VSLVLVGAALANRARNGGNAWSRISLIRGLERLGFDVWLVEELQQENPDAVAFFASVTRQFRIKAALVTGPGLVLVGPAWDDLVEVAVAADVLLNVGGHVTLAALRCARRRIYLDDDPAYTQIWAASEGGGARLEGHDSFFTFGANVGTAASILPAAQVEWRPTRPPVVLGDWPVVRAAHDAFSTVGTWRGPYGRAEYEGRKYGLKLDEFRKIASFPRCVRQRCELALDIHPDERADLDLLKLNGWILSDPCEVAGSPSDFRRYVQRSGAEFSVAQGIYVETNSGWFSDRTTRYLASGKPVLVQETGFREHLPVGEGLLSFRTLREAVTGAEEIASDYERHARAARRIAEEYFDSDKVLSKLLEDALA
jgi:hypothetical protein